MLTKEESKVPLNETSFYIIKKGNWNFTIDIFMSNYTNFNILNLFMIIKSYFNDEYFYIEDIYIIIAKEDNFSIVFKKIDYDLIKTCNYDDFLSFFDKMIYSEKEYLKNYKYVGFKIIFNKNCAIFKTNKIYPIYPWNKDIVHHYVSQSKWKSENIKFSSENMEVKDLIKKIENLEDQNKKLLNYIQFLENKIKK